MWGNRVGWGISVLLLFLMFVGLWWLNEQGKPSGPSDAFSAGQRKYDYLAVMKLPMAPSDVVPMDDPSDATGFYGDAIKSYRKDPTVYAKYKGGPEEPEGIAFVLKAAHCKTGHVVEFAIEEMADYQYGLADADRPPLEAVKHLHYAVFQRAAVLGTEKKLDDQRRYLEAMFALGAKMFDERLDYTEFEMANGFLRGDAQKLQEIAIGQKDPDRAAKFGQFVLKSLEWRKQHVEFLHSFLPAIDGDVLGAHAGDMFTLIRDCKDRMWRVEAVLNLGRMRWRLGDSGRAVDQKYANKLLTELAQNDPDPAVKIAAAKARDLTVENFRLQH